MPQRPEATLLDDGISAGTVLHENVVAPMDGQHGLPQYRREVPCATYRNAGLHLGARVSYEKSTFLDVLGIVGEINRSDNEQCKQ